MPRYRRYLKLMSLKALTSVLLMLLVGAMAFVPAGAVAAPVFYDGNSADGTVAVFSTTEQMVPGDTDQEEDVYVRSLEPLLGEYVTREVSIGPKGGNDALPARYNGMSGDGSEIFFTTREQLVAGDIDHKEDVYVRNLTQNTTTLVSQGSAGCSAQSCGNGESDSIFRGVAPDGGVVFFESAEALVAGDSDGAADLYVRDIGAQTTTRVSVPDPSCSTCADVGREVQYHGTTDSGDKVFFSTTERLTASDLDSGEDIYERDIAGGTTKLVSIAGVCPSDLPVDQNCEPSYGGASADGTHVYFETNERLAAGDTDSAQDVYDWSGGPGVALASTGPDGGNANKIVTYAGNSADGGSVFFETSERLDAGADTDQAQDVYRRSGGVTTLVSAGEAGHGNGEFPASFEWASIPSGSVVAFTTAEQLTSGDEDASQDVYERSGGETTLVSTAPSVGNGAFNAIFAGAGDDGSKVFFATSEQLLPADEDESQDIYMRSGTETVLVSGGQVGGNGAFDAGLRGLSSSGSRAFFTTKERLTVDDDFAAETDLYNWSAGGTLLVSVKNSPDLDLGPPPPTLEGTTPSSPATSTTPAIFGQASAGALVKVYKSFDCSGEPVAQGTAAQLASPGLTVTVAVPIGSTTSYRATAEAEGIVSPCSSAMSYKQEEPAPPVEEGGGETGGGGTTGGGGGGGGGATSGATTSTGGAGSGTKKPAPTHDSGIAYVAPEAKITFGPAFKTRQRRPTFRFADITGQPNTKFFCRVDRKPWSGCTSPIRLKKLKPGRHIFKLEAINAVGTPGAGSVKRAFKVVGRG
jgi:hypothetical protein